MRKLSVVLFASLWLGLACISCSSSKSSDSPALPTLRADFEAVPRSGDPTLTVQFTDKSVGNITSHYWTFGDGGSSTEANPLHDYTTDGAYTVTLAVSGPGGSDTEVKNSYIICGTPPGPTVDFSADVTTGDSPLAVQFTDLTAGVNVDTWAWDFGDSGTSTAQNPQHTYNTAGTYDVTLTATDDNGTDSETKVGFITVTSGGGGGAGVDPSGGSGGTISPGTQGSWECGVGFLTTTVTVYIPTSYDPGTLASPVVWLFNEQIADWDDIADANAIILIDIEEYGDLNAYVDKINFAATKLESEYNVDMARYHFAGWSAGGNAAVIIGSASQDFCATTMVFPGTGGSLAQPYMSSWTGHKIRLYYACGDQDANYSYGTSVEYEANAWRDWYGYTTRFDLVVGSDHYISETIYHKRQDAWNWVKGFNLTN